MNIQTRFIRNTVVVRRKRWNQLSELLDSIGNMSDEDIFNEVKKKMPTLLQATRHECIKVLIMDHVETMVESNVPNPQIG